jgi:hypothetical protein
VPDYNPYKPSGKCAAPYMDIYESFAPFQFKSLRSFSLRFLVPLLKLDLILFEASWNLTSRTTLEFHKILSYCGLPHIFLCDLPPAALTVNSPECCRKPSYNRSCSTLFHCVYPLEWLEPKSKVIIHGTLLLFQ